MRLTRVFVAAPLASGTSLPLPPGPAQHLARVLRLEAGAALRVFNGQGGEFEASIASVRRADVTLTVGAHHPVARESPLVTTLLQGIARGEKMDLILQKSTELGVSRIVPLAAARTNVRLNAETAARKQQHWQAVVIGACEQSGRDRVPEVAAPVSLAQAVAAVAAQLRLILAPDAGSQSLQSLLHVAGTAPTSVCLLVGPEGGFDAEEVQAAQRAGFRACRLGPRVLRTETAGLAALAALQFAAGDLT
ncbi:MAG: 16S rRNA (uracil(1498)-N(3))-methyltransferase [Steroidobacteraceae bacterium]